jgi:type VI secretion system protein ImpH
MATESRRPDPSLEQFLFEEGYRFEFFQAVRVLERLYSTKLPVGRDSIPSGEVVRFRSFLSLTFPPSAIYHISRSENLAAPVQMEVAFLGLAGIQGVLPRHYTELLLERLRSTRFPRHLQSSHDLAILPSLGKISIPRRLRACAIGTAKWV